jgi:shikimate dehydrogenase
MRYYIIGYPLGHTVSPDMHNSAFSKLGLPHSYEVMEVSPELLSDVLSNRIRKESFGGASVTIPYKIEIIKYLDKVSESAKRIGAVNTIDYRSGVLYGYNTDASGGVRALSESYGDLSCAKVVLLGAGGAARALAYELAPIVDELLILNRSIDKAKSLSRQIGNNTIYNSIERQNLIESANILINATPVGMSPKTCLSPVNPVHLHPDIFVYDIIYNPIKTRLLIDAEKVGCRTLSGLWMLVYQGVEAFKIWTGIEPDAKIMYNAALSALEGKKS